MKKEKLLDVNVLRGVTGDISGQYLLETKIKVKEE